MFLEVLSKLFICRNNCSQLYFMLLLLLPHCVSTVDYTCMPSSYTLCYCYYCPTVYPQQITHVCLVVILYVIVTIAPLCIHSRLHMYAQQLYFMLLLLLPHCVSTVDYTCMPSSYTLCYCYYCPTQQITHVCLVVILYVIVTIAPLCIHSRLHMYSQQLYFMLLLLLPHCVSTVDYTCMPSSYTLCYCYYCPTVYPQQITHVCLVVILYVIVTIAPLCIHSRLHMYAQQLYFMLLLLLPHCVSTVDYTCMPSSYTLCYCYYCPTVYPQQITHVCLVVILYVIVTIAPLCIHSRLHMYAQQLYFMLLLLLPHCVSTVDYTCMPSSYTLCYCYYCPTVYPQQITHVCLVVILYVIVTIAPLCIHSRLHMYAQQLYFMSLLLLPHCVSTVDYTCMPSSYTLCHCYYCPTVHPQQITHVCLVVILYVIVTIAPLCIHSRLHMYAQQLYFMLQLLLLPHCVSTVDYTCMPSSYTLCYCYYCPTVYPQQITHVCLVVILYVIVTIAPLCIHSRLHMYAQQLYFMSLLLLTMPHCVSTVDYTCMPSSYTLCHCYYCPTVYPQQITHVCLVVILYVIVTIAPLCIHSRLHMYAQQLYFMSLLLLPHCVSTVDYTCMPSSYTLCYCYYCPTVYPQQITHVCLVVILYVIVTIAPLCIHSRLHMYAQQLYFMLLLLLPHCVSTVDYTCMPSSYTLCYCYYCPTVYPQQITHVCLVVILYVIVTIAPLCIHSRLHMYAQQLYFMLLLLLPHCVSTVDYTCMPSSYTLCYCYYCPTVYPQYIYTCMPSSYTLCYCYYCPTVHPQQITHVCLVVILYVIVTIAPLCIHSRLHMYAQQLYFVIITIAPHSRLHMYAQQLYFMLLLLLPTVYPQQITHVCLVVILYVIVTIAPLCIHSRLHMYAQQLYFMSLLLLPHCVSTVDYTCMPSSYTLCYCYYCPTVYPQQITHVCLVVILYVIITIAPHSRLHMYAQPWQSSSSYILCYCYYCPTVYPQQITHVCLVPHTANQTVTVVTNIRLYIQMINYTDNAYAQTTTNSCIRPTLGCLGYNDLRTFRVCSDYFVDMTEVWIRNVSVAAMC